jgi:DNA-directed RNA polymerase specialized sigma24 family protein
MAEEVSPEVDLPARAETYSSAEVVRVLKSLTTQHKIALTKIAKAYARKTSYGHEDLIQEAYTRVLGGVRGWPRTVAVVPFLCGVMRSIAWDWRIERHDETVEVEEIGYEDSSVATGIDAQRIVGFFNDDPIAQTIIVAMMDGARGEELRELSGLTQTEYESKRTKIRRRLEKVAF